MDVWCFTPVSPWQWFGVLQVKEKPFSIRRCFGFQVDGCVDRKIWQFCWCRGRRSACFCSVSAGKAPLDPIYQTIRQEMDKFQKPPFFIRKTLQLHVWPSFLGVPLVEFSSTKPANLTPTTAWFTNILWQLGSTLSLLPCVRGWSKNPIQGWWYTHYLEDHPRLVSGWNQPHLAPQ